MNEKFLLNEVGTASSDEASFCGKTQCFFTVRSFCQTVVDDSLSTFIPSYKEVLNHTPLQIYLGGGGGKLTFRPLQRKRKLW
jgi:hypothetical protein